MKRISCLILSLILLFGCLSTLISCAGPSHTHTFASDWTYSEESHWKASTCEHNEKADLAAHSFDNGQLKDATQMVYICDVCGYQKTELHTHDFGEWTVNASATVFENGEEIRSCKFVDCTATESRVITKIEITSIFVAAYPKKINYVANEKFDPTGISVKAIGADGSHTDITDLVAYDKSTLNENDTFVTVSFNGKIATVSITVQGLNNHSHTYENEWTVDSDATIFAAGSKYRSCTFPSCTARETEKIPQIKIDHLTVTAFPAKLEYAAGESFDAEGLLVTATDENGAQHDVTAHVLFNKTTLSENDTFVTVSFGGKTARISITVLGSDTHSHIYESKWTIDSDATIFAAGSKHRSCTIPSCTARETEEIPRIKINRLTITASPAKLEYIEGESFDAEGLLVTATDENGAQHDVTAHVLFNKTTLSENDTFVTVSFGGKTARISVIVLGLNNHKHTYEGAWTIASATTIFAEGQKYRICTFAGCNEKEIEAIPAVEVTKIEITSMPEKLTYLPGERFDPEGLAVIAIGADASETDITALVSFDKTVLSRTDTALTVLYGNHEAEIAVSIQNVYSVSEVLASAQDKETVSVEGIFVGIADEGSGYSKEMLIKDLASDKLISIIGVTYGTFPNYGYIKGDRVIIEGTLVREVYESDKSNSQNKNFLNFTQNNPANINDTIVSRGNQITYNLDNVVEINSWAKMKEYFKPDNVQAYTYIHVTGNVWFNTYTKAGDGVLLHRFSMNSSASNLTSIKPDGARAVGFRQNVIETNTPVIMNSDFAKAFGSTSYPGTKKSVDFYAVINATNAVNYQLTILDTKWVKNNGLEEIKIETQQDIVKEIAEAYYRQGTQIHYDQSWRSENASPEDATSQNQLNVDCSSYIYNIYYEAFGHSILGVPLTTKSANTGNYTTYAKENLGKSPDVIGYWETADYTTADEQAALLSYVQDSLEVGDVIVYRHGKSSATAGHTLIYIGNGQFLHSTGTKCTYDEANPENSVDIASSTEYKSGSIGKLAASELFTKTSSSRYLFKDTSSDKVFTFCLLRPLALGLTPTEKTENRMKIPGVIMEKTVSAGLNAAVCRGETITYALSLQNITSNTYIGVAFEETLSDCVAFVSGHAGLTLGGQKLSMKVNLEAGDTLMITWTVRVKADASFGARIESKNTSFGGVGILATENYVSAYTEDQLAQISAKAKELAAASGSYSDPIELAKKLYKDVLGVDLFAATATTDALLSSVLTPRFAGGTALKVNEDSEYADMVLDRLCIGRSMSSSLPNGIRIVEADLMVGDLIFCQWPSGYRLFVYVGNNEFVTVDTQTNTASLVSGGTLNYVLNSDKYNLQNLYNSFRSYKKCVVIRPSIAQ